MPANDAAGDSAARSSRNVTAVKKRRVPPGTAMFSEATN
jgi:hypothetical protein